MKHRALVIGAGRIGAGYNWHDDAYTHAGAYRALSDRVELVGFVEPDKERAEAAELKWGKAVFANIADAVANLQPDIVSVCTQPEQQYDTYCRLLDPSLPKVKAIWQEKPFTPPWKMVDWPPIQVNYMRRGDPTHQELAAKCLCDEELIVYGKDDIHTKCHFEDLAKWWRVPLVYRVFNGPCAYILSGGNNLRFFDNGGVDGGTCFKAMLGNLLDHVDTGVPLWSPANVF